MATTLLNTLDGSITARAVAEDPARVVAVDGHTTKDSTPLDSRVKAEMTAKRTVLVKENLLCRPVILFVNGSACLWLGVAWFGRSLA